MRVPQLTRASSRRHRVAGVPVAAAALLGVDGQVRRAVGDGHDRAVDGDHQQPPPPGPGRVRAAQQGEQLAQRPRPGRAPRLGDRGRGRGRGAQPVQARRQPLPDLRIAQLREQAPRQQQVNNVAGREISGARRWTRQVCSSTASTISNGTCCVSSPR